MRGPGRALPDSHPGLDRISADPGVHDILDADPLRLAEPDRGKVPPGRGVTRRKAPALRHSRRRAHLTGAKPVRSGLSRILFAEMTSTSEALWRLRLEDEEHRRHYRVSVALLGRYMLADQREFACQTINMSTGDVAIVAL